MSLPPHIRVEITVDDMRHKVVHALTTHNDEIEKLVGAELDSYLKSGRLQSLVSASVQKHMDAAIEEGVQRAFNSWSRNSPTVAKAIQSAVTEALFNAESGLYTQKKE